MLQKCKGARHHNLLGADVVNDINHTKESAALSGSRRSSFINVVLLGFVVTNRDELEQSIT